MSDSTPSHLQPCDAPAAERIPETTPQHGEASASVPLRLRLRSTEADASLVAPSHAPGLIWFRCPQPRTLSKSQRALSSARFTHPLEKFRDDPSVPHDLVLASSRRDIRNAVHG
jgi:hypothetical protein